MSYFLSYLLDGPGGRRHLVLQKFHGSKLFKVTMIH